MPRKTKRASPRVKWVEKDGTKFPVVDGIVLDGEFFFSTIAQFGRAIVSEQVHRETTELQEFVAYIDREIVAAKLTHEQAMYLHLTLLYKVYRHAFMKGHLKIVKPEQIQQPPPSAQGYKM